MPKLSPSLLLPLIGLLVAASGGVQTPGTAVDPTRLGPQVGEQVPDFTLPDQRGQARALTSLMGPKGLMLVFSRATAW